LTHSLNNFKSSSNAFKIHFLRENLTLMMI